METLKTSTLHLIGSLDRAILMAQQDVQNTVFKKLIAADREPLSHLVFLGQP